MNFIKNVLATIIGIFVFLFICVFSLIALGSLIGSFSSEKVDIKENSVINLDLEEITWDYGGKTIIKDFNFNKEANTGFSDVIKAIEYAKTDLNIKGIKMKNTSASFGAAQTKELRDKLEEFKKTGKFIVSYAEMYTQKDYYLNSVADTIYLNPVGALDFKGLSTEVLYFKDFQDKTGFRMEVIRHGKYKSAVEPFIASEMSPENKEQISVLQKSIWDSFVKDISQTRKISVDTLNAIANRLDAKYPEKAKAHKMIDKVAYEDEFEDAIHKALGVSKDKDYNQIDIEDYTSNILNKLNKNSKDNSIAVLYAQGEIKSGEGSVDVIGEGSINRALKKIRDDKNIKALVLRINSPGGSALTSDLILREIELTKKVKPVIVSMGDYAASGGYYIASKADAIFAQPTTITGSIGVFGMLPNASEIAQKNGLNPQVVNTHENAADYSVIRKLDDNFRNALQKDIERTYTTFVNHVAKGRKLSFEKVDAIAQGRVWTGAMAKEIGLVDQLGTLNDAIAYAAEKVKIKDYSLKTFPEYNTSIMEFFKGNIGIQLQSSQEKLIKNKIGEQTYKILNQLEILNQAKGVQARIPFYLNIN